MCGVALSLSRGLGLCVRIIMFMLCVRVGSVAESLRLSSCVLHDHVNRHPICSAWLKKNDESLASSLQTSPMPASGMVLPHAAACCSSVLLRCCSVIACFTVSVTADAVRGEATREPAT